VTAVSFDILGHDKASPAFDKVGKASDRVEKKFGFLAARSHGLVAGMTTGFGKIAGAMAVVAGVEVFKDFINEARESAKVGRVTDQVIRSTGGVAKISAKQVGDLATAISNKTGADDEAVQSGENLLLTFTNIKNGVGKGNDIFNQATQSITDMTAALNDGQVTTEGIKASSIQLGKALNDPIKGITALRKVGVSFTDQQIKQIKTLVNSGKTMQAQKVILHELGREFGGAAAAASDPLTKLGVIIGNVKETIGGALLPVVDKAATWLGDNLPSAADTAGNFISKYLVPPLQNVVEFVADHVIPGIQGLYDILIKHDFSSAFRKAFNVQEDSPIVGFLLKVGQGIEGVWNLLVKHDFTSEFRKAFNIDEDSPVVGFLLKINEGVKDAPKNMAKLATGIIDGLYTGLANGDWSKLGGAVGEGLQSALKGASSTIGTLGDAIGALIDKIDWGKLGSNISGAVTGMLKSVDWKSIGKSLGDAVATLFQNLGNLSEKIRQPLKDLISKVDWKGIGKDATDAVGQFVTGIDWGKVAKTFGSFLVKSFNMQGDVTTKALKGAGELIAGIQGEILRKIGELFKSAGSWLLQKGEDLVGGLLNGAASLATGLGSWFSSHVISPVVGAFKDAGSWLLQQGRDLFNGLKNGIADAAKGIGAWIMRAPVASVISPFTAAGKWLVGRGHEIIAGFINGFVDKARSLAGWLSKSVISPVVGAFGKAGSWLVQQGRNLIAGFTNGSASVGKGIGGWFGKNVISPVVGAFSKAGSWLVQQGKNLVAGFKNGVVAIAIGVGSWVYNNVIVPVVRPFGAAGKWLVSHGTNLIGGLLQGIKNDMAGIGKWIKVNVVDPVVGAVKHFFGIKSPSTVFAEIGGHLIGGLIKGLSVSNGAAIANKVFGDMPAALRSIVGKGLIAVKNLPKKAMDALGSAVGIGAPIGGPSGHASNEGIVRTLAAQRGWGMGAEWNSLRALIMGESGFNNTAQNPTSSAYGLFQFLDSTWGSVGASKTSDPYAQTLAGLTYIARSYGDPVNAYSKWSSRSPHWYEKGTPWVPDNQLAYLHKGEAVIPAEVNKMRLGGFPNWNDKVLGKLHQLHATHAAHLAHSAHLEHLAHLNRSGLTISADMGGGLRLHKDTIKQLAQELAAANADHPMLLDGHRVDTALSRSAIGRWP
jgi:hypothetical protein